MIDRRVKFFNFCTEKERISVSWGRLFFYPMLFSIEKLSTQTFCLLDLSVASVKRFATFLVNLAWPCSAFFLLQVRKFLRRRAVSLDPWTSDSGQEHGEGGAFASSFFLLDWFEKYKLIQGSLFWPQASSVNNEKSTFMFVCHPKRHTLSSLWSHFFSIEIFTYCVWNWKVKKKMHKYYIITNHLQLFPASFVCVSFQPGWVGLMGPWPIGLRWQ